MLILTITFSVMCSLSMYTSRTSALVKYGFSLLHLKPTTTLQCLFVPQHAFVLSHNFLHELNVTHSSIRSESGMSPKTPVIASVTTSLLLPIFASVMFADLRPVSHRAVTLYSHAFL